MMEEPADTKGTCDANTNLTEASPEDDGDSENSASATPSEEPQDSKDPQDPGKPNTDQQENDEQPIKETKSVEKESTAATVEKKSKKKNWGQKSGKKGKNKSEQGGQETNEDTELKKDSKSVPQEKSSQGDIKKDDSKKQGYQNKKKDFNLLPDQGGTYSLWVKKPYPSYTHEEAYRTFIVFGSVAEINFLEQHFFVKYYNKSSAMAALKRLKAILNLEPAHVKNPAKNVHGSHHAPLHGTTVFKDSTPRPTEVYIGNISTNSNKKELENLIEDTKFTSLRHHNKNGKGFAFVQYPSLNAANRAVSMINGRRFQGRALMCRLTDQAAGSCVDATGLSLLGSHPSSQEAVEVLVKNLHPDTNENHLYTLFSRYGGADYVQTKFVASKNCVEALVTLHSDWFAQAAIKELQGQIVDGRMLTISYFYPSMPSGLPSGAGHHGTAPHGPHRHGNPQLSNRSFHGPMASHHPAVSKLQQATDLAHRVDALIDEVLDDCHYCERIKMLMSELQYALVEVAEEVGH